MRPIMSDIEEPEPRRSEAEHPQEGHDSGSRDTTSLALPEPPPFELEPFLETYDAISQEPSEYRHLSTEPLPEHSDTTSLERPKSQHFEADPVPQSHDTSSLEISEQLGHSDIEAPPVSDDTNEDAKDPPPARRTLAARLQKAVPARLRNACTTHFSGWRGGVLAWIVTTAFILLVNVIVAIVAVTAWNPEDGIATAFTGTCKQTSGMIEGLHVVINGLSGLLLAGSNYCMQRLVAPTRKDVDRAHAKRKWLDIGVPSIRNLRWVSKWRVTLWVMLGLSSLPLHLLLVTLLVSY